MIKLLRLTLLASIIVCSQLLYAQDDLTVKGVVKDKKDGSGIPGVNVVVKGTTIGTATDIDGNFTLKVPSNNSVLVISSIGYRTVEIQVGEKREFDISIEEETKVLEDVIITAIAIKREKRELGYAVQDLKAADIATSQETNVVNALSGKVAGVQIISSSGSPGAASRIRIRGNSSINGNADPLFVVDGIPIDNSGGEGTRTLESSNRAVDLNPNDIESMTVLKGPAATALYGIRAANGAIIITTKKGKAGKTTVNVSSSWGVDQVNKLPEVQKKYAGGNNGQFVPFDLRVVRNAPSTGNSRSWGPSYDQLRYNGQPSKWDSRGDIIESTDNSLARVTPYDNMGNFFQYGLRSDNYASISGGNDKTMFFLSYGDYRQEGVIPNQTFRRNSIKVTGSHQAHKTLKFTSSASYTYSTADRVRKGGNWGSPIVSLFRSPNDFDITGGFKNAKNNPDAYTFPDGTQRQNAIFDNPFFAVNNNIATEKINRILGFAQVDYQPLKWLTVMGRVGTDLYHFNDRQNYSIFSAENHLEQSFVGSLRQSQTISSSYNSDFLVAVDKDINKDWNVGLRFGHNYWVARNENLGVTGVGYGIPGVENLQNTNTQETFTSINERRLMALYLDGKIGFRNYAFLNATVRREQASVLPRDNDFVTYPSLSLGLVFTEMFNIENSILSYGKLRASIAQVGNLPTAYSTNTYFQNSLGANTFRGQILYRSQTSKGNEKIVPEIATTQEFGTELRFLRNRLSLDFTYYNILNEKQIVSILVPASSGYNRINANTGNINNRGIEVVLGATPIKTDFQWDIAVNFNRYRTYVNNMPTDYQNFGGSAGFSQGGSGYVNGEQYGLILGSSRIQRYGQDPNDLTIRNDLPIVVGPNGLPIIQTPPTGKLYIVGNPNPDWLAGIRNTLSYKGFSLSGLLDIKQGGDMFNLTKLNMQAMGTHITTEDRDNFAPLPNSVYADGTPNVTPIYKDRNYYANFGGDFGNAPERGIEDASWIRMRELTLSYKFNQKICDYIKAQNLSLSLTARNLFLITPYTGIDPETNAAGNDPSFGRDAFNLPNTRSFVGSLNVTF